MTGEENVLAARLSSIAVLIPVWRPERVLVTLVKDLLRAGVGAVVLVDDGSEVRFQPLFAEVRSGTVTVLRHERNRGKGRALKTGFTYLCAERPELRAVVTAAADGHHAGRDIVHVAMQVLKLKDQPVLGVRSFLGGVPRRSRIGNLLTRKLFRYATGVPLWDTQTGLRGLPLPLLPELAEVDGERDEYELAMLAHLCRDGALPAQVLIDTMNTEGNRGSHFRPLLDSMRVYRVLVRLLLTSVTPDARVPMRIR